MKISATPFKLSLLLTLALTVVISGLLIPPAMSNRRNAPSRAALRTEAPPLTPSQARENYGRIPLSFEANQGQTAKKVDFLARGDGYTLFLTPTEAVFQLRNATRATRAETASASSVETGKARSRSSDSEISAPQSSTLRMKLVGANTEAKVEGAQELAGKVNYFNGDDSAQWRTNVPTFGRVRYSEVYPGIDVVYYGNQRQLEYDFVVAPRSDPQSVGLRFEGADRVEVDAAGDLLLSVGEEIIRQPKPVVYQEVAGRRRAVEGGYVVERDGRVRFALGEYDAQLPLVIDPVLVYSTYLGGSDTDEASDIKVDSAGNAYICGETLSTNFPTANAFDATFAPNPNFPGSRDAFVTKLNNTGSAFVYSTYLGGAGDPARNGDDRCFALAVDSSGNAYVAGETHSHDFPTANAYQATFGGGFADAFVTKLDASGSSLVYSTFIGGTVFDAAGGIAVDSTGNAYITGRTTSSNYPTLNPIQAAYSGGPGADVIITKLNAAGNALVYSTYLGGSAGEEGGFENGSSIAVDSSGNAYVTGQTRSTDFPTHNPIQATFGGGFPTGDGFVTKVNPTGNALVYSTYLGGSENDNGQELVVDSAGNAYIAGTTASTNFPTANAFQGTYGGGSIDGFITKLSADGSAYIFSTYFGGSGGDSCNDIALESNGNVSVAGGTDSTNFPLLNPIKSTVGGTGDAFVSKLNPTASALIYSTYLGGSGFDRGNGIAVDSAGSLYVVGITISTDFPTLNPRQAANGGVEDGFVTKITEPASVVSTFQFGQASYQVNEDITSVTVTVTRSGDTTAAATVDYATMDGTATERADYTTALGTLRFAVGENSKTFDLLVNEDSHVEGAESFSVTLSNPTGGGTTLGTNSTATIQIADDATEPPTNAIDDTNIFVGQHYHDFLNRQGDPAGIAFWASQITACGTDAACIDDRRNNVSAAFFLSIEFQQTGYFVFRIYKETFTDSAQRPRGMPRYREFLRDTQEIGRGVVVNVGNWEQQLETNKQEFAKRWVQSAEFVAQFPVGMTAEAFVDKLFQNSETTPTAEERNAAIAAYGTGNVDGRAAALRSVAESGSVYNRQYNAALVLMQYIGYLRRNPNDPPEPGLNYAGYDFWLTKLNNHSLPGEDMRDAVVALGRIRRAEMVRAFLISGEYRGRFGQ